MLIKLTFFYWVKKFYTHALCTIAQNFVSNRTLIHSTVCIIYGKPGSVKKKTTSIWKSMPILCSSFPVNIQLKSWVFSILWNLMLGVVPYFFHDERVFCTDSHLDGSLCLHTSVGQCFMKQFSSWLLWWPLQLSSNQSRNDLCKEPNATETSPKDNVCMKGSHPVFLCAYFLSLTQGSSSEYHLLSHICYHLIP